MFEHHSKPLLPRRDFLRRLGWSVAMGAGLIVFSLSLGMGGYHWLCGLAWIDAFLEATMIMSGMGPLSPISSTPGKLFAGCYAIYCGIALIGTTGIIFSPVIHRALHRFHLQDRTKD